MTTSRILVMLPIEAAGLSETSTSDVSIFFSMTAMVFFLVNLYFLVNTAPHGSMWYYNLC